MNIKKQIVIEPQTTDGKTMIVGKKYIFNANGKCYTGAFLGLGNKGAVKFKGLIVGAEVLFNVMPKSITEIYESEVE